MNLMRNIICILAIVFFISECSADARVLEQIRSEASAKARKNASKIKKPKKKVKHKASVLTNAKPKQDTKPKLIVTKEDLDVKDDIAYLPNEDTPFTGKHQEYHSNGKKYIETTYKNGKKDGVLIMWDEYEHKIGQLNYLDGKPMD